VKKEVFKPPNLTNENEMEVWCLALVELVKKRQREHDIALQGNEVGIASDSEVVKQRSHDRAKKQ
jgi:hypothetical protein